MPAPLNGNVRVALITGGSVTVERTDFAGEPPTLPQQFAVGELVEVPGGGMGQIKSTAVSICESADMANTALLWWGRSYIIAYTDRHEQRRLWCPMESELLLYNARIPSPEVAEVVRWAVLGVMMPDQAQAAD